MSGIAMSAFVETKAVGIGHSLAEEGEHADPVTAPLSHGVMMLEGDRSMGFDHHVGGSSHRGEPGPEVPRVVDGGRQADEGHVRRRQYQNFFPHRPAIRILEVVHLVEDDDGQVIKHRRAGEQHVPQDFRGHDHDRSL